MELKNYLHILIRWTWLLLLCALLGAGIGYIASRLEKPIYQASTKILVSKDLSDQTSQFAAMNNQQLIDAYVQLLTSTSVVDEASRRLNYEIKLKEFGSIQQVQSTNVIEIIMDNGDPKQAAAIANMLVEVLMDQNSRMSGYASTEENIKEKITQVESQITTLQTEFNQISDEKLQSQLKQVNDQITTIQDEILKLTTEIVPLTSLARYSTEESKQLAEKQAQLAQLQSLLSQYQQIRVNLEYFGKPASGSSDLGGDLRLQLIQSSLDHYQTIKLDLLENLQTVQLAHLRNIPTIEQIEKAVPPAKPVRPLPAIYIVLGWIVGLMLALGLIIIIEYLDDTLKSPKDIRQMLEVPVLGSIVNTQSAPITKPVEGQVYSPTSEALYALRTNLELAVPHHPLKTLLLLSINEFDNGGTNLAADLAVNYAQSGNKVVLVDADLRNPGIHNYFGLSNENGLSDLLVDNSKTEAAGKKVEGLDGMTIITSGTLSPATVGLLKPEKISSILKILMQQSDVIIINAPSIKAADSWVLASKVDGVLLVIQPRVTHRAFALKSMEQLYLAGATIIGAVLYQNPHDLAYYFRKIRDNHWSYNWPKWSFWHANNP